jgi:Zn-dependent protease with chaperone function
VSASAGPWALPLIAFFAAWLSLCPAAFALHRLASRRFAALPPGARSASLLALAMLPVTVAALVAVLGFTPTLGGLIVDQHCHPDTGCGAHVPIVHAGAPYALAFGALLLVTTLALCAGVLRRLQRTHRVASTLGFLAEPAPLSRCEIIESSERFAYCIGLWRPKVVISRGLESALSTDELNAVVAHEHAHAARRDNLRHGLAALALLPLGPRARRALLADLSLASEEACDHAALRPSGDAGALLGALATFQPDRRALAAHAIGFGAAATLESRVAALARRHAQAHTSYLVPATVIAVYTVAVLTTTYAAHHGAELLLGWLG